MAKRKRIEETVMEKNEEQQVRAMLAPIVSLLMQSYLSAMILRIDVHRCLAIDNGAEPEDLPAVVANAIESAEPVVAQFLDDLGEVRKAKKLGELR